MESPQAPEPEVDDSSYLYRQQSLKRLRVVLLIQWALYAGLLFIIQYFSNGQPFSDDALSYWLGFTTLSAPGHVALVFWRYILPSQYHRRAELFVSGRLDLQVQGLGLLNFFMLALGFIVLFTYFELESDVPVLVSMCCTFPALLLFGGLIWLVFFKKDAAYVEHVPPKINPVFQRQSNI
jgi:hypothetical protein